MSIVVHLLFPYLPCRRKIIVGDTCIAVTPIQAAAGKGIDDLRCKRVVAMLHGVMSLTVQQLKQMSRLSTKPL